MLCQKCWNHDARVHFTLLGPAEARERAYCLACAQEEHLSWLLVWGYATRHHPPDRPLLPEVLPQAPIEPASPPATLVATAIAHCTCGCHIVAGAQLPCGHHAPDILQAPPELIEHICHCGRELQVPIPALFCPECNATQTSVIIASVETCVSDEKRRRLLALDHDLRGGRVTWATFAIKN